MNALPLKGHPSPNEVIDDLIADIGIRRVLMAIAVRIVRRTRPPDQPVLPPAPELYVLSDHLRRDLGLPPHERRDFYIDVNALTRRDLY